MTGADDKTSGDGGSTLNPRELKTVGFAIGLAAKMVGGIAGGGVGLATANPVLGGSIGAAIGHALDSVGKELFDRHLAPRQQARAARALLVACVRLEGKSIRNDGFFDAQPDFRSDGEEVTEAMLLAAINAAEERKVDFLAHLYAEVATDPTIDAQTAHLMFAQAQSLPYRSFVLLGFAADRIVDGVRSPDDEADTDRSMTAELEGVQMQLFQLLQNGFVVAKEDASSDLIYASSGVHSVEPERLYLSKIGRLFFDSLCLSEIPQDDLYRAVETAFLQLAAARREEAIIDGGTF